MKNVPIPPLIRIKKTTKKPTQRSEWLPHCLVPLIKTVNSPSVPDLLHIKQYLAKIKWAKLSGGTF